MRTMWISLQAKTFQPIENCCISCALTHSRLIRYLHVQFHIDPVDVQKSSVL